MKNGPRNPWRAPNRSVEKPHSEADISINKYNTPVRVYEWQKLHGGLANLAAALTRRRLTDGFGRMVFYLNTACRLQTTATAAVYCYRVLYLLLYLRAPYGHSSARPSARLSSFFFFCYFITFFISRQSAWPVPHTRARATYVYTGIRSNNYRRRKTRPGCECCRNGFRTKYKQNNVNNNIIMWWSIARDDHKLKKKKLKKLILNIKKVFIIFVIYRL